MHYTFGMNNVSGAECYPLIIVREYTQYFSKAFGGICDHRKSQVVKVFMVCAPSVMDIFVISRCT